MADEDEIGLALSDVIRGLQAEVARVQPDGGGLRVEGVTVDLDVCLERRGQGDVAFRVGKGQGGGKRAKTRVSVTLHAADAAPSVEGVAVPKRDQGADVTAGAAEQTPVVGEVTPPEPRAPGLVDVLADALKTIADTASRSAGSGWPPRPGPGGDSGGRGQGR